jgi:hypothetical protein
MVASAGTGSALVIDGDPASTAAANAVTAQACEMGIAGLHFRSGDGERRSSAPSSSAATTPSIADRGTYASRPAAVAQGG